MANVNKPFLNPEDIEDIEVREWFESRPVERVSQDNAFWLPVLPLINQEMKNYFVHGLDHYKKFKKVSSENPYFKWLIRSDYCYRKWDQNRLISTVSARMEMVESMKRTGFDLNQPIVLLKHKYNDIHRVVLKDRSGQWVEFDVYDGHHRVLSANMAGIDHVPAVYGEWPRRKMSYVERMSVENNWEWYQPIDFERNSNLSFIFPDTNQHGRKKYEYILKRNLEPIHGYRFLDLGCNTGVITACIAADRADSVIGLDFKTQMKQTWCVSETLWCDYGNLDFYGIDLSNLDEFQKFIKNRTIDCILMSNFIYYLGDKIDDFMSICSDHACRIVLQGNDLKKEDDKSSCRIKKMPGYRGEYSQIEGMTDLLIRHGYETKIDAPIGYTKPVVSGVKKVVHTDKPSIAKASAKLIERSHVDQYMRVAMKRLITTLHHAKPYISTPILDVGGNESFGDIIRSAYPGIDYHWVNQKLDLRRNKLPYDDNKFGIVLCWETIEHLWCMRDDGIISWDGILNAWKEMYRVLKPKGVLHLTTTNRFCPRTLSFFRNKTVPQICGSNLSSLTMGHARELSSWELSQLSQTTNMFLDNECRSKNVYGYLDPGTKEFDTWKNNMETLIGRKLEQHELYDTLFFVATKTEICS